MMVGKEFIIDIDIRLLPNNRKHAMNTMSKNHNLLSV